MSTETIRTSSETLQGLQSDVERITLESDAVFMVDRYTTESVSSFFSSASHAISGYFQDKSDYLGDLRPSPDTVTLLTNMSAKRLEALVLPTPIGFKGNVAEYLKVLVAQRIQLIDNFEANILSPLEDLVGLYVNRPSLMGELKLNEVSKKFTFCDLDAQYRERAKFANNKNTEAALFYSLYRSTGEFNSVGDKINTYMAAVEKVDVKGLRTRIEGIEERLNVLTEYFADKDNPYKLSGNVARELSKLILQVAEHAEQYAYLRYKTLEIGKSFRDGFEAIAKQA